MQNKHEVMANLQSQPDLTLVQNIKDNNELVNESLEVLASRHSGLYISTVMKITGSSIPNLREELLDEKLFITYKAALSYEYDKGTSFSTHLANEAKWNCLKNKTKKSNVEIPCDNEVIDIVLDKTGKYDYQSIDDEQFWKDELLKQIASIEDETARKIINMRYFSGDKIISWKKIAKSVQLSIQGCIDIHNRYVEKIKKRIHKKYKEIKT